MLAAALISRVVSAIPGCECAAYKLAEPAGTEGSGDGSYTIQAQLTDVVVISAEHPQVRVADVNVGKRHQDQVGCSTGDMRINGDVICLLTSTAKGRADPASGALAHRMEQPPTAAAR